MSNLKYIIVITIFWNILHSQDIAFVGNSTTRNQYPTYTKNYLYNYKIMNYAVTGAAVIRPNYEYRYKQEFQDAINRKAKYTIILLGSCDWWIYGGNEDHWGTEYKYLANTLNNHSTVILGLIPYRIKEPNSDQVFDQMNSVIKIIANDIGAPIVDFNKLLDHNQNLYFDDGIHPNITGQQSMGSLLASLIQQLDNTNNSGDNNPPETPKNFYASCIDDDILLQWDPNTEADLSKYFLFRGLIDGGQTTGIKTLHKNYTSFVDTNVTLGITYYYQIAAGDSVDNRSKKSDQISATPTQLKIEKGNLHNIFFLKQNFPNPFNPCTTINYSILEDSHINITIYDLLGKTVKNIVNQYHYSGDYYITWDGTDYNYEKVCNGTYLCEMRVGTNKQTRKIVVLK